MLFELKEVSKIYGTKFENNIKAIDQLNLKINKQDFVAIVGPSGSGKTTLLNLLAGLIQPTNGEVFYNGIPIHTLNEERRTDLRLRKMGFVFQDYQLLPTLTAYENIELPLRIKKLDKSLIKEKTEMALEDVSLKKFTNRFPRELSGGQQQRVAIARALANGVEVILADEPTANLDSKTATEIVNLFKRFNREYGITFIFSTHDPRLIDKVDRVISLEDGKFLNP
jgi:putative ABC transport system ATP-binding protein